MLLPGQGSLGTVSLTGCCIVHGGLGQFPAGHSSICLLSPLPTMRFSVVTPRASPVFFRCVSSKSTIIHKGSNSKPPHFVVQTSVVAIAPWTALRSPRSVGSAWLLGWVSALRYLPLLGAQNKTCSAVPPLVLMVTLQIRELILFVHSKLEHFLTCWT